MFYFLLAPVLIYHWILILAAVIPAVFLMIKVYRSDHLEKESGGLLLSLVGAGVLSSLLALVEETVGQLILGSFVSPDSKLYNVIMFFVVVGLSEESSKYIFMKRKTWNHPEFNCKYDGVVYALFTSLGFALWENIMYVLNYGFSTALVRAVTAIPGHASFGVFCGVFYGLAKQAEREGDTAKCRLFRIIGVLSATVMHGAYDYLATMEDEKGVIYFFIYVIALFILAFTTVNKASKTDRYI